MLVGGAAPLCGVRGVLAGLVGGAGRGVVGDDRIDGMLRRLRGLRGSGGGIGHRLGLDHGDPLLAVFQPGVDQHLCLD